MRTTIFRWGLAIIIVGLIILKAISFILREGETSVVTRFGKPVRVITEAGLHLRFPWPIEGSNIVDSRRRTFTTRFAETLTRDKKNVILVNFAVWSVHDPLKFIQAVGTREDAESKLDGMISNAKNAVMGRYDLSALISTDEENLKVEEIEESILREIQDQALSKFGVDLRYIGIKRVALPEENVRYVFDQMRAERAQYAARAIAEGRRLSAAIRAQTEVEKAAIISDAEREAALIRGDADAQAAKLYADAERTNPSFFRFLRSLEALKRLVGSKTTLILSTESDPFRLLEEEQGTG
jgi:membrane protease subunit HflC